MKMFKIFLIHLKFLTHFWIFDKISLLKKGEEMVKTRKSLLTILFASIMLLCSMLLLTACGGTSPTLKVESSFKTDYFLNEELSTAGGVFVYTDGDGKSTYINASETNIVGFDSSTSGEKKLYVSYQDATVEVPYNVFNFVCDDYVGTKIKTTNLTGGSVKEEPYYELAIYAFNNDYTGIKNDDYVNLNFSYTVDVQGNLVLDFGNRQETGKYDKGIIEMVLSENAAERKSLVCEPVVTPAKIELEGDLKAEYYLNDKLDVDGVKIKYTNEEGQVSTVNLSSSYVSNFDTSVAGEKQLTINYNDLEMEIPYKVYNFELGTYYCIYSYDIANEIGGDQNYSAYLKFNEDGTFVLQNGLQEALEANFEASTSSTDKNLVLSNMPNVPGAVYKIEYDNTNNIITFYNEIGESKVQMTFKKNDEVLRYGKYSANDGQYLIIERAFGGPNEGLGFAYLKNESGSYETSVIEYEIISNSHSYSAKITSSAGKVINLDIDNDSFTMALEDTNIKFTYEPTELKLGTYNIKAMRVINKEDLSFEDSVNSGDGSFVLRLTFNDDGTGTGFESHGDAGESTEFNYITLVDSGIEITVKGSEESIASMITYYDNTLLMRMLELDGEITYYILEFTY